MNRQHKRWLDFQPGIFTMLGYELNSLIDQGQSLTLDKMLEMCEDYTVIGWLNNNVPNALSLWDDDTKIIMAEEFASMANAVDCERKMLVTNNGICLLVAYCFAFIDNPPSRNLEDCDYAKEKLTQLGYIS